MKKLKLVAVLGLLSTGISSTASAQVVTGRGTSGYIPVWIGHERIADSVLFQSEGDLGIGTQAPQAALDIFSTNAELVATIRGVNNATTGINSGVQGLSNAPSSFGVIGIANGVNSAGVSAVANATSGISTTGVNGISFSSADGANGVYGQTSAATGVTFGVQGFSLSSRGVGVQGSSPHVGLSGFNQSCGASGCTYAAGGTAGFVGDRHGGQPPRGPSRSCLWSH